MCAGGLCALGKKSISAHGQMSKTVLCLMNDGRPGARSGACACFRCRAINPSNDCLTVGKAALQLLGGKGLEPNPYRALASMKCATRVDTVAVAHVTVVGRHAQGFNAMHSGVWQHRQRAMPCFLHVCAHNCLKRHLKLFCDFAGCGVLSVCACAARQVAPVFLCLCWGIPVVGKRWAIFVPLAFRTY